jgi:sugar/nucleoside kinase (ribokinase family)
MQRPKILVLGNGVMDVVARPVDEVPRTGSVHPQTVTSYPGGCGGNVAVVLARLGVQASLLVCIGEDLLGEALLLAWQGSGVDTSLVGRVSGTPTGIAIVLVDSSGERRFISTPGANNVLTPAALTPQMLEGVFALHVGGFFAALGLEDGTLAGKLADARARGILTSLDPVGGSARQRRENLYPLLPHLDILSLNDDEGEKVTGEREPEAMIGALLGLGARTVILKLGQEGCIVAGERGAHIVPAFPATVVDSTGAGDAFDAALLASLARGDSFEEALRWGTAAGAATVEALGPTGVWRGWDDLTTIREGRV